jgi:hypothetical protein
MNSLTRQWRYKRFRWPTTARIRKNPLVLLRATSNVLRETGKTSAKARLAALLIDQEMANLKKFGMIQKM